eukprot:Gregarina_sp_Pseudo_9__1251@NODE_182_length_3802_cov_18_335902_g168_i0_p2_GENE_NODE_182_length_3802_cov_18_335902_g168_i0NODE_182_length_3802_cov_18_335902_g168_i0_p2_ORF_typecomplete_len236_score27_33NT5C/PF06941_12/1_6e33HAD_2/PF13419_6/0_00058HAD/PF12710_7/0_0087Put_Phosphatase/PF06888_12/0_22Hydrolase/PF00702_26/0_2_NODE_182_length_3802_cov_18_335902_g168_i0270977
MSSRSSREVAPSLGPTTPSRNCICSQQGDAGHQHRIAKDGKLEGTILVDMDNTLNDWDAQFRRVMSVLYSDFKFASPENRRRYCIEQNYPPEWTDKILDLTRLQGFWSTMPPAPGAVEAMHEMAQSGLNVWVVSAPDSFLTGKCAKEKYEWIETHLGPEWKNRLILTQDKTLIHGDLLIDDKPDASTGCRASRAWRHVAYCQPYNEGALCPTAVARLHRWSAWKEVIPQLLEQSK